MPNELLGALTGLLGVALQGWAAERKAQRAHRREVELRKLDAELAEAEAKVAQLYPGSAAGAGPDGSLPFLNGRVSHWVHDVRGMVRPAMSIGAFGVVAVALFVLLGRGLGAPAIEHAFGQMVDLVDYLTASVVVFWFGGRVRR